MHSVSVTTLAWFSLAWFLVGVAVGKLLPANAFSYRTTRRSRSSGNGSSRGRGTSGGVEIYVGNLAYTVSKRELAKSFGKFGEVTDVRLIRNRASGKSRGYGFVIMADVKSASAAVKALNGTEIKGRPIVANEAKSRSRD